MTRQAFNVAIAEKVMGWEAKPSAYSYIGYDALRSQEPYWRHGVDFAADDNAASLVRQRVAELGVRGMFVLVLTGLALTEQQIDKGLTYGSVFALLSATPERTARAAYRTVTGVELEACDE